MVAGTAASRTAGEVRDGATGTDPSSRSSGRLAYVDALRVGLIVLVVAHHAGQAYGPGLRGVWPVSDPDKSTVFGSFFSVNAAFFMGLFFLISAHFVPVSFDRKGPVTFVKDRVVRLGTPLVVIPVVAGLIGVALSRLTGGTPEPLWSGLTAYADAFAPGHRAPAGCATPVTCALGHLWFVEQLLFYVVLYAGWRLLTRRWSFGTPPVPGNAAIFGYAVVLAIATFVVRIHYPINRWVDLFGFLAAEVGHLPQYASMFVVGLLAARGQWLQKMPTRRGLLWLGIGVAGAALRYLLPIGAPGGLGIGSLIWSTDEAFIATGLCLGLIVLSRACLAAPPRLVRLAGPNTYGVYIIHLFFVLPLQFALLSLTAPAGLKFALVTAIAVPVSFALTALLRQLPGVRAVL